MDARPLPHLRSRCTLPPRGESEPTLRAAVALLRVCGVSRGSPLLYFAAVLSAQLFESGF